MPLVANVIIDAGAFLALVVTYAMMVYDRYQRREKKNQLWNVIVSS